MNISYSGYVDLTLLCKPRSVVLVGASDKTDSIGGRALVNLLQHSDFQGELFLVNPVREVVAGRKAWPNIKSLPSVPDLAVIAVPAAQVIAVLNEAADRGVRFSIVFTSGFGEVDEQGKKLEAEMRSIVARSGMRIYGPNCPGLSNINAKLGFTFSPSFKDDLRGGPVGLATQGGALGRNVLQSMDRGLRVGLWCSSGNECDLQVPDFIHYMAQAPDIAVIGTVLEGIKDGPKFIAAVQAATAQGKPVIALKIGRSKLGMRAAQSHTGSMTGSAEVNAAVFKQLGIIEVDDIDELVDTIALFARARTARGKRIAVFGSSGGAGALAADMLGAEGLELSDFAPETIKSLSEVLPSYAAINNPVDTTAAILSDPLLIDRSLEIVCRDPDTSIVLFPISLAYGEVSRRMADSIVRIQQVSPIPIVPVWMSSRTGGGYQEFAAAGMVPAMSLGKAAKLVRRWLTYAHEHAPQPQPSIGLPYKLPKASADQEPVALSEHEAKQELQAAGLPFLESSVATSVTDARRIAAHIGFPLVAKVSSAKLLHKSDIGGVKVGLKTPEEVETAWADIISAVRAHRPDVTPDGILLERMAKPGGAEIIIGITRDATFGHVMTFGLGGIYVETFADVSRRLLPVTLADAECMIREIKCYPVLNGARGRPRSDLAALARLMVSLSDFVQSDQDAIEEVELNPVWVGREGEGAFPLDAVILKIGSAAP